jgi:hypothetical protein
VRLSVVLRGRGFLRHFELPGTVWSMAIVPTFQAQRPRRSSKFTSTESWHNQCIGMCIFPIATIFWHPYGKILQFIDIFVSGIWGKGTSHAGHQWGTATSRNRSFGLGVVRARTGSVAVGSHAGGCVRHMPHGMARDNRIPRWLLGAQSIVAQRVI